MYSNVRSGSTAHVMVITNNGNESRAGNISHFPKSTLGLPHEEASLSIDEAVIKNGSKRQNGGVPFPQRHLARVPSSGPLGVTLARARGSLKRS